MLCPKCGTDVGKEIRLCDACRPASEDGSSDSLGMKYSSSKPTPEAAAEPEWVGGVEAGFWIRFAALVVDIAVVGIPTILIQHFIFGQIFYNFFEDVFLSPPVGTGKIDVGGILFKMLFGLLIPMLSLMLAVFVVAWLYSALFESSASGATPGKRFCGLRVVTVDGHRVGFWRATARHFLRLLSLVPFLLGYLMSLFTARRQALHDIVSGTAVLQVRFVSVPLVASVTIILIPVIYYVNTSLAGDKAHLRKSRGIELNKRIELPRKQTQLGTPPAVPSGYRAITPNAVASRAVAEATPTASPTEHPDARMWKGFPEAPSTPHAFIGVNGTVVTAQTVVGFAYPAGNNIALAFFPEVLSPEEVGILQKRGSVTSAVNDKRALLVLYLTFPKLDAILSEQNLVSYTANFSADASSLPFSGPHRAVSVSRTGKAALEESEVEISGSGLRGGKLSFELKAKASGAPNGQNKFRWDISGSVILLGPP